MRKHRLGDNGRAQKCDPAKMFAGQSESQFHECIGTHREKKAFFEGIKKIRLEHTNKQFNN